MGFVTVPPSPFPPSSGKTGDIAERVTELETNVSTLQSTKAPKTDIAPAFSAETNYSVGDLVYYDGALYECTTEHTVGAWNSEHFTDTAIDDQLNAINSNIVNATKTEDIASQFTLSEKVSHFQAVKRNNVVCITVRTSNEAHSGTETLVTIPQSLLPSIGEYAPVFDFSTDVLITGAAGLLTISESKIICAGSYTGRGTMSFTYII